MMKRYILFTILFGFMTLSGFLDAYRILIPRLNTNIMYTKEEYDLAQWAKENTDKNSIWLTGTNHNNWVSNLTGRQCLLAFEGWLWTHGYDYLGIKEDAQKMFLDPRKNKNIFSKYKIHYIAIGWEEKKDWKASRIQFAQNFKLIKRTQNYLVFSATETPTAADLVNVDDLILNLSTSAKISPNELQHGLVKQVFHGINFTGTPIKKELQEDAIKFEYNMENQKPFQSPFSIRWKGYIQIPNDGIYNFRLESDDGSELYIDSTAVVLNSGPHGIRKVENEVYLSKGFHKIQLDYFDGGGGAILKVKWQKQDGIESPLLVNSLFTKKE